MCFQIDYVNFNFLYMFSSQEAVKTPTTKAMALRATTKKRLAPKSERPWSTTCSTRTQIFRLTRKCDLIHSPPGEKLSFNLKFFPYFLLLKKNSNSLVSCQTIIFMFYWTDTCSNLGRITFFDRIMFPWLSNFGYRGYDFSNDILFTSGWIEFLMFRLFSSVT